MIGKYVRTCGRFIRFSGAVSGAAVRYFFSVRLQGKSSSIRARAEWLCASSRRVLASLNIEVERQGVPPAGGLLAANHLGYIDIIVLGAAQPMVFLSKSEVRRWPVFGFLADCAGTLFIRRDRRFDVARFDESFARVVGSGVVLGIFPEGTSTDGRRVLPFHSSLFAPAAAAQWPVTPAWIGYRAAGGTVENDVSYWGDMTFLSHFVRMISLEKIKATVVYGGAVERGLDRKQMARELHHRVCIMAEDARPAAQGMAPG
jgi:1-acyl-sn-glycerol-3-phosphate acyltransferase